MQVIQRKARLKPDGRAIPKNSLTIVYHLAVVAFKLCWHQGRVYSSDDPCGRHALPIVAFKLTLMLQKIHARPITEVETVGIQGHPMHPGWNNRGQHLMIERKPANVLNSYLFRLVIQRDPRIT